MSSKGIKRSRKELDSEIPAEEITVTPTMKKSPGRPRKLESEKKKYVPSGSPRGRPRVLKMGINDPEKKKGQRGRPPAVKRGIGRPRTLESEKKKKSAVKRGIGRPRKLESEKKKKWVSTGRPRGRPRIYQLSAKKVISLGK